MARVPKYKKGDILQVAWSGKFGGLIRIDDVVSHSNASLSMFYVFSHLTGDTIGRENDMRCLATVEDLLKAKPVTKVAKVLYGSNKFDLSEDYG